MNTYPETSATTSVELRALPNTVVFGFVKSLATELSRGQVELPSVPEVVIKLQRTLADENVSNETVVLVVGPAHRRRAACQRGAGHPAQLGNLRGSGRGRDGLREP